MFSHLRHSLYREKQRNPEMLHHNFTQRISTGVYRSRILSSIYILLTLDVTHLEKNHILIIRFSVIKNMLEKRINAEKSFII